MKINRKDIIAIGIIILIVIVYHLPMLFGWLGIFWDDFNESYPRIFFDAKWIQKGVIPLWAPHTFSGGRLNFMPYTEIWYWPMYPFFILAPTATPDSAFFMLVKLPRLLHWLICALTAYGLGRGVIRLSPVGATVLALIYAFGTPMANLIGDPPNNFPTVWIPLALWGIISFVRDRRRLMGILGALSVCFIAAHKDAVDSIFALTTICVCLLFLAVIFVIGRIRFPVRRLLFFGLFIMVSGILLAGPQWSSFIESLSFYRDSPLGDVLKWKLRPMSMPWRYLLTLVVPDAFGTVTGTGSFENSFGVILITEAFHFRANLTGGFWLILLCVTGSFFGLRSRIADNADRRLRLWWYTGLSLLVFSILLITGCYSPVYGFLVRVIPLFGLPYPLAWRIMEHLGIAILAGVSAHWLWNSSFTLSRRLLLISLLIVIAAFILCSGRLIPSAEVEGPKLLRGSFLPWLIRSPFLYLQGAVAGIILLVVFSGKRWSRAVMVGAALLEIVILGFCATYFITYYYIYEKEEREVWYQRFCLPSESPFYMMTSNPVLTNLPAGPTGPERTTFYTSQLDEMATLHCGDYLLGNSCRPMIPRLTRILSKITKGWPYDLHLLQPTVRYLPNMSVRYLIWNEPGAIPPDQAEAGPLTGVKGLYKYRLFETIPRVFSQDRIICCTPEEAMNELLNGDLRRGAFIEGGKRLAVSSKRWTEGEGPGMSYHEFMDANGGEESLEHFDELQKLNQINRIWFPNPNRMNIEIDVKIPALLISTDIFYPGWEVEVDGLTGTPLQINYLQRGVWLEEGSHRVEWVFRPKSVKWGFVGMGAGLIGLFGLLIYPWKRGGSNS